MSQAFDVAALAAAYASKSPQDILKLAFEHFGDDLWISFSGAEDVVLVDMAWKLNRPLSRTRASTAAASGDNTSMAMP